VGDEVVNWLQMRCVEMRRERNPYIEKRRWTLIGGEVVAADR
jgi:hypothetical protein